MNEEFEKWWRDVGQYVAACHGAKEAARKSWTNGSNSIRESIAKLIRSILGA